VGSYSLDFGGELKKEVDVDIEVGLGSLTIIIPNDIGAHIMYEKNWISHIELDNDIDEREENNYYTSNYYSSKGKINFRVEAGFGSVKIKRQ
jgi:predicted membrane protein